MGHSRFEGAVHGVQHVVVRDAQDAGVVGGIARVAGFVTGVVGNGVFKGLDGRHARGDPLTVGVPMRGQMRLTRLDNGKRVEVSHHANARRCRGLDK